MLAITEEERRALSWLYSEVKSDVLKRTGLEVEGGHVEIYDVYLKSDDDVGVALYYNSIIHEDEKPLTEYITFTDARIDAQRFGFFKASGEPLQFDVEELPDKRYALHVRLDEPVTKGCRLDIYCKAHMGGSIWMEAPHHRGGLREVNPYFFDGMRSVPKPRYFHATLWKMPKGCILFEVFPQPWEIYVENDRLNILFVFYTTGLCKMCMKYLNP
jgi:hypothetical protein